MQIHIRTLTFAIRYHRSNTKLKLSNTFRISIWNLNLNKCLCIILILHRVGQPASLLAEDDSHSELGLYSHQLEVWIAGSVAFAQRSPLRLALEVSYDPSGSECRRLANRASAKRAALVSAPATCSG